MCNWELHKAKNVIKCSRQLAHYRAAERRAFQTPIALPEIAAAVVKPGTEQEHCFAHWNELSQRQIGTVTNTGLLRRSKTKCPPLLFFFLNKYKGSPQKKKNCKKPQTGITKKTKYFPISKLFGRPFRFKQL